MWAIFKTIEYGFGDRLWCLGNWVFPVKFINNLSKRKITNCNLDLNEVRHSVLTESVPTVPLCLPEIHSLPHWSSSELWKMHKLAYNLSTPSPFIFWVEPPLRAWETFHLASARFTPQQLKKNISPKHIIFSSLHDFARAVPSAWTCSPRDSPGSLLHGLQDFAQMSLPSEWGLP